MEPSELGLAFTVTFICQPVNTKQTSLMEFVDVPEENIPPFFLGIYLQEGDTWKLHQALP